MLVRYGDSKRFLSTFNPNMQGIVNSNPYYVYKGDAPQLVDVRRVYGDNIAESWIEIQLFELSEYAGNKTKLTTYQTKETARVIIQQFGFLKISELMAFFYRFKGGRYGKFYGAVDPLTITSALQEFVTERSREMEKFENEYRRNQKRIEDITHQAVVSEFREALATCHMTPTEWLAIDAQPRLTNEEIRLMGWAFRLTPTKTKTI